MIRVEVRYEKLRCEEEIKIQRAQDLGLYGRGGRKFVKARGPNTKARVFQTQQN